MSSEQRWERVKQKKVCFNCLQSGHHTYQCKMSKRVHKLLASDKRATTQEDAVIKSNSGSNNILSNIVILKTLLVTIRKEKGVINVRVFFDDGSQRSYISTKLANAIDGKVLGKFFERNTLFSSVVTGIEERTIYEISMLDAQGNICK